MADAAKASDLDVVWVILSAVLVFFMQVGFAMVSRTCTAVAFFILFLLCRVV